VDPEYFAMAHRRVEDDTPRLLTHRDIRVHP
jgi:hypothetical protein